MGRKKSKRVVVKKRLKERLETSFTCPFCNEESAVECKLDRSKQTASVKCRSCQAGYQTVINTLSEPIDVFAEWIDAIDAHNKRKEARASNNNKNNINERSTKNNNSDDDVDSGEEDYNRKKNENESETKSETEED